MRVDKFLKVSRIIKRRTVAASAADGGRISVNGKEVKPGYRLKVGDEVTIGFGARPLKVRVKELRESTKKEDAERMYEVIE
ncbi:RNA-binding S4 domain-containing protein [Christensenellaceae bacterium 44-20]